MAGKYQHQEYWQTLDIDAVIYASFNLGGSHDIFFFIIIIICECTKSLVCKTEPLNCKMTAFSGVSLLKTLILSQGIKWDTATWNIAILMKQNCFLHWLAESITFYWFTPLTAKKSWSDCALGSALYFPRSELGRRGCHGCCEWPVLKRSRCPGAAGGVRGPPVSSMVRTWGCIPAPGARPWLSSWL